MTHHSISAPRFRGEIIQKIYRVWLLRKLLPVLVVEIVALSFIIYRLGKTIFIQRVIENALTVFFLSPPEIVPFTVSAFEKASSGALVLGAAFIVALAFLIRHVTQGILRFILVRQNYFSKLGDK